MKTRNDLPDLAHRLILRAARKAPAALTERLEEEWLADLQSRSGAVSRLRLAIGCCWATGIITRDFRIPQLAASGVSGGHKPLWGDLRPVLPVLSRRTLAFIVIAAVHVLVIAAFTSGLAQHVVAAIPELTHVVFVDDARPEHPKLPPLDTSKVVLTDPEKLVPRVEPQFHFPADEDQGSQTAAQLPPGSQDGVGRAAPPVMTRAWGGPGKGFPTTDEYYPLASRRLGEVGVATVGVCVDGQGRLTGDPTLAKTSGSRRIDEGALRLAKAGSGHYRPTTDDGQAVGACFDYRINFELN
ncbi:MAG: TonB family protein [Steroidobacteraceae bacterium]